MNESDIQFLLALDSEQITHATISGPAGSQNYTDKARIAKILKIIQDSISAPRPLNLPPDVKWEPVVFGRGVENYTSTTGAGDVYSIFGYDR
jgi:hypothetical protein